MDLLRILLYATFAFFDFLPITALVFGDVRPNFLFITTDQERNPPVYETDAQKSYRKKYWKAHEELSANGIRFNNHYIASSACVASRACLYTGQHITLHGVSQTTGLAKMEDDPKIQWLVPGWVPTIGDYFRAGGYDSSYIGKWHLSFEDILDSQNISRDSWPVERSDRDANLYKQYKEKNKLDKFGFDDWVGPEPHGARYENTGWRRDKEYTMDAISWIKKRNASDDEKPFFLAVNLVNPHDICLKTLLDIRGIKNVDDNVPPFPVPPTWQEDLSSKPDIQKKYKDILETFFWMTKAGFKVNANDWNTYGKLYYFLHTKVDEHISEIYNTLKNTRFFRDTIVILTSDHGEMAGAHGGMVQKWAQAYEETTHVPLIISNPRLFDAGPKFTDILTSHLDLLPSFLGLADLNEDQLIKKLKNTRQQVFKLPGKDLTDIITGKLPLKNEDEIIYFRTVDTIIEGKRQRYIWDRPLPFLKYFTNMEYDSLTEHNTIEMIISRVKLEENQVKKRWKIVRYFDDPSQWAFPHKNDTYLVRRNGPLGTRGDLIIKKKPNVDQFELYNLDDDPYEINNRALQEADKKNTKLYAEEIADH